VHVPRLGRGAGQDGDQRTGPARGERAGPAGQRGQEPESGAGRVEPADRAVEAVGEQGLRCNGAEPPRSDRNQSDAASGAQAGASSAAVPSVSGRGGELPSAAASQSAASSRPARRPTGATAQAAQRPSGEITGACGTVLSTMSSAVSSML
jgi:hypothetical protein